MDKQKIELAIGGEFYTQHFRNGKLIHEDKVDNLFIDEGLIYAINAAFGASVGGAPSVISQFYVGLSKSSRNWTSADLASTIHTVANEAEDYVEATRPQWLPQSLASSGTLELNDSGAEATFTINADFTTYGAFLINAAAKDGTGDSAGGVILAAGSNFTSSRNLLINDVFKVGYVLAIESKV